MARTRKRRLRAEIKTSVNGGIVQGVVGAQSVVIENLTFYGSALPTHPPLEIKDGGLPPCPYPGLAYFGPQDGALFFGRDAAITRLETAVGRSTMTTLVGASGSGKSSVVLAGLAPRLHARGGWRFSHFRVGTEPDKDPFRAMARALVPLLGQGSVSQQLKEVQDLAAKLASGAINLPNVMGACRAANPGRRILLVADQFEELFALVTEEAIRIRFIETLLAGFPNVVDGDPLGISLVLTLRADFYGMALRHRPLADALQGRMENLGPMTREELREAIVRPAGVVAFESGLVETLLDDVVNKPGSLPLLQFALREMWARLGNRRITRASYDAIGGVEGALAQRAQAIFEVRTEKGEDAHAVTVFRRLFTRLVTLGEGAEDTRRIVGREELGLEAWALAQSLAGEDNRLVVTSAQAPEHETAEVVHEALIRNWPTLIDWITRDRAFHSWLRQLKPRVDEWRNHPEDEGTLLRGGPLTVAEEWLQRRGDEVNEEERRYIERSVKRQMLDLAQKERLRQRMLQGTAAALLVVTTLAGVAGFQWFEAVRQRGIAELRTNDARKQAEIAAAKSVEAEEKRDYAIRQTAIARANYYASVATSLLPKDPTRALRLIHEAKRTKTSDLIEQQFQSIYEREFFYKTLISSDDAISEAKLTNGGRLVTLQEGEIRIYDLEILRGTKRTRSDSRATERPSPLPRTTIANASYTIQTIELASDELRILGACSDGATRLWNTEGELLATYKLISDAGDRSKFDSPNIFTIDRMNPLGMAPDEIDRLRGVRFKLTADGDHRSYISPDTKLIASSYLNTVVIAKLDGTPLTTVRTKGKISTLAFSPDSKYLFVLPEQVTADDPMRLLALATPEPIVTAIAGGDAQDMLSGSLQAVFAPGSDAVLVYGFNQDRASLWSVTGQLISTMFDNGGSVSEALFTQDSQHIVLANGRGEIAVWEKGGARVHAFKAHSGTIRKLSIAPNDQLIASKADDGEIRVWRFLKADNRKEAVATLKGLDKGGYYFSPDSSSIYTYDSRSVRIWPLHGVFVTEIEGSDTITTSLDGKHLASSTSDGTVLLYDTQGRRRASLKGHRSYIRSIEFSPDGDRLLTASSDNTARLWDLGGIELAVYRGHTRTVQHAGFSRDGSRVITTSYDGTSSIWNLEGKRLTVLPSSKDERWANKVIFGNDNTVLMTQGDKIIEMDTAGNVMTAYTGHKNSVKDVKVSPDGKHLLSLGEEDVIILWDRHNGGILFSAPGSYFADFSLDGTSIWTGVPSGSVDHRVQIYDLIGNPIRQLEGIRAVTAGVKPLKGGIVLATEPKPGLFRIRPLPEELLGHDEIDELSFENKLEYGILTPETIIANDNEVELIDLNNYLLAKRRTASGDEKQNLRKVQLQTVEQLVRRDQYPYHAALLSILIELQRESPSADIAHKIVQEVERQKAGWSRADVVRAAEYYISGGFPVDDSSKRRVLAAGRELLRTLVEKGEAHDLLPLRLHAEIRSVVAKASTKDELKELIVKSVEFVRSTSDFELIDQVASYLFDVAKAIDDNSIQLSALRGSMSLGDRILDNFHEPELSAKWALNRLLECTLTIPVSCNEELEKVTARVAAVQKPELARRFARSLARLANEHQLLDTKYAAYVLVTRAFSRAQMSQPDERLKGESAQASLEFAKLSIQLDYFDRAILSAEEAHSWGADSKEVFPVLFMAHALKGAYERAEEFSGLWFMLKPDPKLWKEAFEEAARRKERSNEFEAALLDLLKGRKSDVVEMLSQATFGDGERQSSTSYAELRDLLRNRALASGVKFIRLDALEQRVALRSSKSAEFALLVTRTLAGGGHFSTVKNFTNYDEVKDRAWQYALSLSSYKEYVADGEEYARIYREFVSRAASLYATLISIDQAKVFDNVFQNSAFVDAFSHYIEIVPPAAAVPYAAKILEYRQYQYSANMDALQNAIDLIHAHLEMKGLHFDLRQYEASWSHAEAALVVAERLLSKFDGVALAKEWATHAFASAAPIQLYNRKFLDAERLALRALGLDPGSLWAKSALARAYIFSDNGSRAVELIQSTRNTLCNNKSKKTFGEVLLDQLRTMEGAGITNATAKEIIDQLTPK